MCWRAWLWPRSTSPARPRPCPWGQGGPASSRGWGQSHLAEKLQYPYHSRYTLDKRSMMQSNHFLQLQKAEVHGSDVDSDPHYGRPAGSGSATGSVWRQMRIQDTDSQLDPYRGRCGSRIRVRIKPNSDLLHWNFMFFFICLLSSSSRYCITKILRYRIKIKIAGITFLLPTWLEFSWIVSHISTLLRLLGHVQQVLVPTNTGILCKLFT